MACESQCDILKGTYWYTANQGIQIHSQWFD